MRLTELASRKSGVIVKINGRGAFRKRIGEMGFIKGREVTVIKNAPLQDPVEYSIMGYKVTLRRSEASLIEVNNIYKEDSRINGKASISYDLKRDYSIPVEKIINVALIGNPNCGKTSIFNASTRSYEHVGNYGGVTVETKLARIEYQGYILNIYDLPGTYSLSSYSPDEVFVRNFLIENPPDVVVNVVDAKNLERNLYLTTQLIDMNIRIVMALNMYDELKSTGNHFNHISFGSLLGIPVIPTVGSRGKGLARLFEAVIKKSRQTEHNRKKVHINYGQDIEDSISKIRDTLIQSEDKSFTDQVCPRFAAIKLLEKDVEIQNSVGVLEEGEEILELTGSEIESIEGKYKEDTESLFTDYRYGFIAGALKETYTPAEKLKPEVSEKVDKILTHKYLGIPIFFFFLWLSFISTFKLGQFPVQWIENGVAALSSWVTGILPTGDLQHLLVDGVIGGVGGIIVFLPNILILFFFISFMEDTGYMARAAFIMDKVMHKIGLHGKSFIPLVMGFGCNVPAIMSTRIIESRNNRLLTMLILPFMSCSARLPVYILIIGAFFPTFQGTILFGIYLTGIFLAVISALIFKRLFFRKEDTPFVMELPPYRMPTLKNTTRHMWNKASQYLKKIGGIILIASVIIWGLNYYPSESRLLSSNPDTIENTSLNINNVKAPSYLERIGKTLEPVMRPLGFDWKATVSLLAGISAKEVVVSTMGVLYQAEEEGNEKLTERLRNEKYETGPMKGENVFTPAVALAFLMFILIYFPCIAVIATISKESGSMWWALLTVFYTTGLAWIMSYLVYNIAKLLL
ncbi:MAG: ferrous iron transport protein B [Bacteroidales bacterium]